MNVFTIQNSYRIIRRGEMAAQIEAHKIMHPVNLALRRSTSSLVREWAAHNLLYNLRVARSHTASVDFETPQKWYVATIWFILSCFYWH